MENYMKFWNSYDKIWQSILRKIYMHSKLAVESSWSPEQKTFQKPILRGDPYFISFFSKSHVYCYQSKKNI